MPAYRLLPHQSEALSAALTALAQTNKSFQVLACGTGKTILGRALQDHLAPRGRVLTLVPRVSLVPQSIGDFRNLGDENLGTVIAVCSDPSVIYDRRLNDIDVLQTTDPGTLAKAVLNAPGRVTVVATYQALDTLIGAHRDHGLPEWEVAVLDEAHRLVGSPEWARALDDAHLPVRYRNGVTATPRVLAPSTSGEQGLVTMDDPDRFGPRSFTLGFAEAIDRGLLAPYRVASPVITHDQIRSLIDRSEYLKVGGQAPGALSAQVVAVQLAVMRAMREVGNHRALTFHPRLTEARLWARTLPQVATLLDGEGLPTKVWSRHLNADHPQHHRSRVLEEFTAPVQGHQIRALSSVGLFREGVDVPACDTAVITHQLSSLEAGVQMLSRALRIDPDRPDKVALFVLPVVMSDQTDPCHLGDVLADGGWGTLWAALRVLGALDESFFEQALRPRPWSSASTQVSAGSTGTFPAWWSLTGIPTPPGFAEAITVRAVDALTPHAETERYLTAFRTYVETHRTSYVPRDHATPDGLALGQWIRKVHKRYRGGHRSSYAVTQLTAAGMNWDVLPYKMVRAFDEAHLYRREHGDLNVPTTYVTPRGYALGHAIRYAQRQYAKGLLSPAHVALWEAAGMVWSPPVVDPQYGAAIEAFLAREGHLSIPSSQVEEDGYPLGVRAGYKRVLHNRGEMSDEEQAWHDQRGFVWDRTKNPDRTWTRARWEKVFAHAEAFFSTHGHLDVPSSHKPEGIHLRTWVMRQLQTWDELSCEQRDRLQASGASPSQLVSRTQNREKALVHAEAFFSTHGHLDVPSSHKPEGIYLRQWIKHQQDSWDKLPPAEQERLRAMGATPSAPSRLSRRERWEKAFALAEAFFSTHGHVNVPLTHRPGGFMVRDWLKRQRARWNELSPDQQDRLRTIGWSTPAGEAQDPA
ncbi:helicase associated domain-containing protein [Nocardiopsis nanhaiensis]